jgi:hypothetical protein
VNWRGEEAVVLRGVWERNRYVERKRTRNVEKGVRRDVEKGGNRDVGSE